MKFSAPSYDTLKRCAAPPLKLDLSVHDLEDVTMSEVSTAPTSPSTTHTSLSTTTTPTSPSIDHQAFPHIIDKIFNYSSLAALGDLSRANRAFNTTAHELSAQRHLIITLSRHGGHMDVGLCTPLGPIPHLPPLCEQDWNIACLPEDSLVRTVLRNAARVEIRGSVSASAVGRFAPYLNPTMVFRNMGRNYPLTAPVTVLRFNMCPRTSSVAHAPDGTVVYIPTTMCPAIPRTQVDTLVFAVQYSSGFPCLVIDPTVDGTLFPIDPLQPMPRQLVLHFTHVDDKKTSPAQQFSTENLAVVTDLVHRAIVTVGNSGNTKLSIVGLEEMSHSWIVCPSWSAPVGNTWLGSITNELGRRLGVNWANFPHCRFMTFAEYQQENDRSDDDIAFERGMEVL